MAVVSIVWALVGFSLAFDVGNPFVGGLRFALMKNVAMFPSPDYAATIPFSTFTHNWHVTASPSVVTADSHGAPTSLRFRDPILQIANPNSVVGTSSPGATKCRFSAKTPAPVLPPTAWNSNVRDGTGPPGTNTMSPRIPTGPKHASCPLAVRANSTG